MIRVAIETSTSFGTVAVARDDRILAEVGLGVQVRHAEKTLPALEYALEAAGVEREQVEEVVVGGGPGSFTGVRVAGATAKGLVAALDVPLRSFPSLLALAAQVVADRPVCALLDARRGEVYAGCWRAAGPARAAQASGTAQADEAEGAEGAEGADRLAGFDVVVEPMVAPVDDVLRATTAASPGAPPVFVGDGAHRYRDALVAAGAVMIEGPAHPRASTLLWLAARDPGAGRVEEVRGWEPEYIRASSAERGVAG